MTITIWQIIQYLSSGDKLTRLSGTMLTTLKLSRKLYPVAKDLLLGMKIAGLREKL